MVNDYLLDGLKIVIDFKPKNMCLALNYMKNIEHSYGAFRDFSDKILNLVIF